MVKVFKPRNLAETLKILAEEECIIFAGGTDLMVKNRRWSNLEPGFKKHVVFISSLGELRGIRLDDGFLRIGAACTCTQIMESPMVPDYFKEVLRQMASPGIRNAATLGGNICNSSPAGDSLPLLYALDGALVLKSLEGTREVKVEDFILGPGKNVIRQDEILTEIRVRLPVFDSVVYKKVGTRKSTALSKLSFIGMAKMDSEGLHDIRIAFGTVGPVVVRSRDSEKRIMEMSKNKKWDVPLILSMYGEVIRPINDQRSTALYRKKVCLRLLEDFLNRYAMKVDNI